MAKKKEVEATVKLQIPAGSANPSPPVGPALGQRGVNIMEFCKAFNAKTENLPGIDKGTPLPVVISVYKDRSFTFVVKTPPAAVLLMKVTGVSKGSSKNNAEKIGTVSQAQLEEIAKMKAPDLSAATMEAAVRTIAGTAVSMGFVVEESH